MGLRRTRSAGRDMFGNRVDAPKTGLSAPSANRPQTPRTSGPRPVPAWLVPWLIPLFVVFVLVVIAAAPTLVAIGLLVGASAVIAFVLARTNRSAGFDYSAARQNNPYYARWRRYTGRDR